MYLIIFAILINHIAIKSDAFNVNKNDKTHNTITIDANQYKQWSRERRSADNSISSPLTTPSNGDELTFVTSFPLNDSHEQLTVHWSGKGSSVVICLAKNRVTSLNASSAVYISYDYGASFESKSAALTLSNGNRSVISNFYISPALNSHYIFVASRANALFLTKDYGKTFKRIDTLFKPKTLLMHPINAELILVNDDSSESNLWLSQDFGDNWRMIQSRVKQFYWGVEGIDESTMIYVQRKEPSGLSTILSSNDFFESDDNTKNWLTHVEEFELSGKYMFATRRVRLIGRISELYFHGLSHSLQTLQLWVSYEREHFLRTIFPNNKSLNPIDYNIVDISDNEVMACVAFNDSSSNLYVSEQKGTEFLLSLKNVLYLAPNGTDKNITGLEWSGDESLVDVHKVLGVRGIYIASKWKEPKKSLSDLISVITFDRGSKWQRIKPPQKDADGDNVDCDERNNCSLHLSQKFSSLYPNLRLPPIVSRSSAVGLVMASGVVGTSIKGKPNIYLTTDAGLTWHHVLNGNYIFAFGDYGGIIVAIAYYSKSGATNELSYSIDEGESWTMMKFSRDKIRVYGLMTEPGEKTTIFTLFGSKEKGKHEWVLFKLDLSKVFKSQCRMSDDYKLWSPHEPDSGCLMGRREVFQRRIANHKCYNGQDFIRPVETKNCPCRNTDFECDFGFDKEMTNDGLKCTAQGLLTDDFDPFSIPKSCKVGMTFNRTRGYRKISGDTCVGGQEDWYSPEEIPCPIAPEHDEEFLLFVQRQSISRLALNENKPIKEELIPKSFLINAIAADFDHNRSCVYWSDIGIDKIMRLCLDGRQSEPEVLVETGLESVEGIALNVINNHLYFVDGEKSKVEMIRTDIEHEGRMRRTVLNGTLLHKPRGITINALIGYLFLTDWSSEKPGILRSDLDGDNLKVLFNNLTVSWPNGITIDYLSSRIYWVDAKLDYVASSDYDGNTLVYVIRGEEAPHPFGVTLFKNWIYYDDWNLQRIILVNKNDGSGRKVILDNVPGAMDLKAITVNLKGAINRCSDNKTNPCTHLCVAKPYNGYKCLCPDGFIVEQTADGNEQCKCDADEEMTANGACKPKKLGSSCTSDQFTCDNGLCIQKLWHCDGDNDCTDSSDEKDCDEHKCGENEFTCKGQSLTASLRCIPKHWHCDYDKDCPDGSDEDVTQCVSIYPKCNSMTEFQCKNYRCIDTKYVCDLDDNCRDGSDELNCTKPMNICRSDEFRCNNGECILALWRCDGEDDCHDGSDEHNCNVTSCSSWAFKCKNGKCIFDTWRCDGENDCHDGSDEEKCDTVTQIPLVSTSTHSPVSNSTGDLCEGNWFRCKSVACVPLKWKCDGVDDCGDNSDEFGCDQRTKIIPASSLSPPLENCGAEKFQCKNGVCIWDSWICDGAKDCDTGEDEVNCNFGPRKCRDGQFECVHVIGCIPNQYVCDGKNDCRDNSDEWGCHSDTPQHNGTTKCRGFICKSGECIERHQRCNHRPDCFDGSDEENCREFFYVINNLKVDPKSVSTKSFTISWDAPTRSLPFRYMPTYGADISIRKWLNTSWSADTTHTIINLEPGVTYNVSVYCKLVNETKEFPLLHFISVTTESIVPDPPRNVTVIEISDNSVQVKWLPPKMFAPIKGYRVYHSPPFPPNRRTVKVMKYNYIALKFAFEEGVRYTFWVTTLTSGLESANSNTSAIIMGSVNQSIHDLNVTDVTNSSVAIEWKSPLKKDKYLWHIQYTCDDYFMGLIDNITSADTKAIVSGLSPGVKYQFKVFPIINGSLLIDGIERNSIIIATKGIQLPCVKLIKKSVSGSKIELMWEKAKYNGKYIAFEYGVYIGLSQNSLKLYNKTAATKLVIKDLHACESYIVQLRIIGPFGIGPSNESLIIETQYDPLSPPKNVSYHTSSNDRTQFLISWNSSCPHITTPIGYQIYILETTLNRDDWFQLLPRVSVGIEMNLTVHIGAKYEIRVRTDYLGSRFSDPLHLIPYQLPKVQKLNGIQAVNGSLYIAWKANDQWPLELTDHKFSYLLYVSTEPNVTRGDVIKVKKPPVIYSAAGGKLYYVSVAIVEEHGYVGELSDAIIINNEVLSESKNVVGIVMATLLVIIALVTALGIYIFRHKRLQRSFLSFVTSHYSNHMGTATYSAGDGLVDDLLDDEDEDGPVFRGFSDDEPLVLA